MAAYAVRLPMLCMFCILFQFSAQAQSGGQDYLKTKISYSANNVPLSKALKEIRVKSKIRFTYSSDLIERQQPVSISMKEVTIEALLQKLLANTKLKFSPDGMGGITIFADEKPGVNEDKRLGFVLQGRVTDANGHPIGGVSIKAHTSNEMTVTQADGLFSLTPINEELITLSMIGMKPLTITARQGKNELQVFKMDTIARDIQEVVVNGYQKIDPRLATGSVVKLSGADIIQPGVPTVDRMLQGKVPGLMVINSSGGANAKPTLRMRGTATLVGNASPLWVIDGMIRPEPVNLPSAVLNNVVNGSLSANYELMGNAISGVNPYDIESITFLKDAAATAIYGTRAANGVIVVSTKRGKAGPTQFSYNATVSFNRAPKYSDYNMMNSKERIRFSREMLEDGVAYGQDLSLFKENYSYEGLLRMLYAREITEAEFQQRVAKLETENTDWLGLFFRNSMSTNHSLSMGGGAGKTTFYASATYNLNNGAAKNDGNRSYGMNVNIHSQVTSKLQLDLTVMSNYRKSTGYYNGVDVLAYSLQTSRTYNADLKYPQQVRQAASGSSNYEQYKEPFLFNMKNELAHTENTTTLQSTTANLSLDYKLGKGWTFRNNSSIIYNIMRGFIAADEQSFAMTPKRGYNLSYQPTEKEFNESTLPRGGIADFNNSNNLTYSIRNSFDYTKSFFAERDHFNFTIGNEIRSTRSSLLLNTAPGYFPERGKIFSPSKKALENYSKNSIIDMLDNGVGYYANMAYNFKGRYILNGLIRTDGSNRFGQYSNSRFLPNYDISARWNAAAEQWFPTSGLLSDWQIRASFGTQGNVVDAVGPQLIASYKNDILNYYDEIPKLTIKSMPYPDLRWEKTYQWNIGTNVAFLDNKLRVNVDYYNKRTVDVIDQVDIPFEYGMGKMYRNGNTIVNAGLEMSVGIDVIKSKNTFFTLSLSSSKNLNKLSNRVTRNDYYALFGANANVPGRPISGFYSYSFKGLDHNTGIPTFNNMDHAFTSNPDDILVYSGQLLPKVTGTINPVLRYKAFSFSTVLYLSLGATKRLNDGYQRIANNIMSGVPPTYTNLPVEFLDRWRKPGDEAYTNIPTFYDRSNNNIEVPFTVVSDSRSLTKITVSPYTAYFQSDIRTINNDYLRCTNINMGYALPPRLVKKAGLKTLSVSGTVNNVFVIANKRLNGQDPETDNFGSFALPITRQYSFTVNTTF